MRSLRDLVIFVLCGIALIVWGIITLLSPGAVEVASAGSPYWTIPLGVAMLAAGIALDARARRRRSAAVGTRRPVPSAQSGSGAAAPAEEGPRGPEGTAPPAG
ncbi:hypothetical protein [Streptomonospora wellingtoniae]|uniref:DUF3180 domain-containing protein n=1 Tax=Streptomonospora wellingtoniae TaxID=3075544 RepID=A0ABU2KU84_9ACTN|nr:hypothetical protein [Streptomonospora sp. DSM 45055]MDT0302860.1 hypothetical protein [Streptomonospora sp. DSM 45055]